MHYIIMFVALIVMYYMNYLGAATDKLGTSIVDLGTVFPFSFMPPGVTFMVAWATIFIIIGVYLIASFVKYRKTKQDDQVAMWLFLATCITNILWLVAVGKDLHVLSVVLIILLMLLLWKLLSRYQNNKKSIGRAAFGLYYGWISIATTVIGLSQVIYTYFPDIALSTWWAYFIILIGVITTVYSWIRWRNPYALIVSLRALGGACVSMFGK